MQFPINRNNSLFGGVMNSLFFQLSAYSATFLLKSARSIPGYSSSLYGSSYCSHFSWKRCINHLGIQSIKLGSPSSSLLSRFTVVQCYSSQKQSSRKRKSSPEIVMESVKEKDKEKEAFFVVRKGDIVGVYKSLNSCQAQVGSSICDPPVSVYKGFSLPKDAEEYLAAHGLQNALYTIKASDLKDDLFGTLSPCPFQEPASFTGEPSSINLPQKRPHDVLESGTEHSCVIHFDGASKGNPGQAGAGVVLRTLSGSLICRVCQGLGIATNNVAEYRAVILGLKKALEMGYTSVQAIGDSKLVCMQLQGLWKVKNQNMAPLHAEATNLKDQFSTFKITHVLRELNSDADEQANFGVSLADGQVQEFFQ